MNEDLANIQYSPILNYNYAQWFQEVKYNGKTLTESEKKELVSIIDVTIAHNTEGLNIAHNNLEYAKGQDGNYYEIYNTVVSVLLFVLMSMNDSMVAAKYFLLAESDYEKRFMRGKLFVILNEGFKRLYGFEKKTHKNSEWDRLLPHMRYFPEVIYRQYQKLTCHLEKHAHSSSWWMEERNLETHMDAEKLYASRQEDIVESKVMMDSMKLFSTLIAVNNFFSNMHTCLYNFLVTKYKRGELKDE